MIAVDIAPGQVSDAQLLEPILDDTLSRVTVIDELIGDKTVTSFSRCLPLCSYPGAVDSYHFAVAH